jgi:hypothetical protein
VLFGVHRQNPKVRPSPGIETLEGSVGSAMDGSRGAGRTPSTGIQGRARRSDASAEALDRKSLVLVLVAGHGARVLQRLHSSGADGQPLEFQPLEAPSAAALDDYMTDERRLSLADERDRAVARTQVIDV